MTNPEKAELFCKEWLEGKASFSITTSGTTGIPKTIELRRDQMIASATKTIKALGLREGMTSLVCLDVNFIAGKMMIVRSLLAGMNMIVVEPVANPLSTIFPKPDFIGDLNAIVSRSVDNQQPTVSSPKIDFVALVPYQLRAILDSTLRGKLHDIGCIILGGAPIGADLTYEVEEFLTPIYATFGMTETLSHIALQRLNGRHASDYFEALDGVDVSIDERQCLVIKADYLDHKVVTNDVVELLNTREFRWLGRYDNVINTGGIKVMPEKIEKLIDEYALSQSWTNRYFIGGLPHEQLGQQVVLVIEGMLTQENEDALMNKLRTELGRYEVPKQILYCTDFISTLTQKINRSASLKLASPRPGL